MAVLVVQDIDPVDGIDPTFDPADVAGDESSVGAGHFVVVKNGDALAGRTVTFRVPVAVGGAVELVVPIGVSSEVWVALPVRSQHPHVGAALNRHSSERATWTYDDPASVTVAALRAP